MKPPAGALVNPNHPFARKFVVGLWINSPHGHPVQGFPITWGSAYPRTTANVAPIGGTFAAADPFSSNLEGVCANFAAITDYINLGADPVPAAQATFCIVRKKTDTTNRNPGYTFGIGNATGAKICQTNMPFSDGTTYFDFGGQSAGTTRISVPSLTYSTTLPERWIFIAGSRGMAIWRNGVKVASQGTANPGRTVDTSLDLRLNRLFVGADGDLQHINFFMVIDDQWDDAMCRWWSAEPYAHLYNHRPLSYAFVSGPPTARTRGRAQTVFM